MGFYTEKDGPSPLAIPQGTIVSPRKDPADWSTSEVFGAAWRTESAIGSWLNGYSPDTGDSIEEGFRPYEQIQGTPYEDHAERFVGVRNSGQLRQMQAQIDREIEDRKMLAESGGLGMVASMAAAMVSPSVLLPGGQIVRGAKGGISIARSALSTGVAGGTAAALDEAMLHATQQTRTAEDSAWAVGGSVVLSGILGGAAGAVGRYRARDKGLGRVFEAAEQQAAAREAEDGLAAVSQYVEASRKVGSTVDQPGTLVPGETYTYESGSFRGDVQFLRFEGKDMVFWVPDRNSEEKIDLLLYQGGVGDLKQNGKSIGYLENLTVSKTTKAVGVEQVPQQILMKAREDGKLHVGSLVTAEREMLEAIGMSPDENGMYFVEPLLQDADRRIASGEWDQTLSIYDVSYLKNIPEILKGETTFDIQEAAALPANEPGPGGSLSAGSVADADLSLRNEGVFQAIKKIPGLRWVVQSDPLIRLQTSASQHARLAALELAESPSVYAVNEQGLSPTGGIPPVEAQIKAIRYGQEAEAVQALRRAYGSYWNDGEVGAIGNLTAPTARFFSNLTGSTEKLSRADFNDEVGKALVLGDHPIPQVNEAASKLRELIFAPAEADLKAFGVMPDDLELKHDNGYLTRIYNTKKIDQSWNGGGADDLRPVLIDEFTKSRDAARLRLIEDNTVDQLEAQRFKVDEQMRGAQRALDTARRKAVEKRGRAEAAVTRHGAVGRASAVLRRAAEGRQADLQAQLVTGEDRTALQAAVKDARNPDRHRPVDLLQAIRSAGGIKDDRIGTRWTGKGWKGEKPTDLETILDTKANSIRRKNGKSLDDMRYLLEGDGYDVGATEADFLDTIRRAAEGEDIFSRFTPDEELARYNAALELADEFARLGIDISRSLDEIIKDLPGKTRSQAVTKGKAQEAGRAGKTAGKKEDGASASLGRAMDRLEEAQDRLRYLDDEAAPKVREEIAGARDELRALLPQLRDAKKARSEDEIRAAMDDLDVEAAVDEVRNTLLGLKPGQPHYRAALSSPMTARALDVPTEVLFPWLETDAEHVMAQYVRHTLPEIEMMKRFQGDVEMQGTLLNVRDEFQAKIDKTKPGSGARKKLIAERKAAIKDIKGIRDRLLGRYGMPDDPSNWWVVGGRVGRAMSYPAFLGNMTFAAIPDPANVIARNGFESVGGIPQFVLQPQKFFGTKREAYEMLAAHEYYLNGRANSLSEMFDPMGRGSRVERVLGESGRLTSLASGMIPWNMYWKTMSGVLGSSRLAKAATAMSKGKATKRQMRLLGEGMIEPWMADRIAKQLSAHGELDGSLVIPNGRAWDDAEAFDAFKVAMRRESDIQVITPGQDVPLTFSQEGMKFILQFKRFLFSMHHRFLIAGITRADAEFATQFMMLVAGGAVVSNAKAYLGGYEPKTGAALWVDAIDRAGVAGWLMEPLNLAGAASGGRLAIGGEPVSRYQARSVTQGALGPTVDMVAGFVEGLNGVAGTKKDGTTKATWRDVRKLMRPLPMNNAYHLQWIFGRVEDAAVSALGAKPRDE